MTHGMRFIPGIDLRGGRMIRLLRGELAREFDYEPSPVEYAAALVEAGARYLHVIDLGAAFQEPPSTAAIRAIVARAGVPVQVGGGIRSEERLKEVLDAGADRVMLGTRALADPEFLERAAAIAGPARVMPGLDFKGGKLAVDAWRTTIDADPAALGARFRAQGLERLLVTAIDRDGTFLGPDVELWRAAAAMTGMRVIGAGGIGSMQDLEKIIAADIPGLEGVVAGRALLEGRIDPAAALRLFAE
ncbi:MAG TPA: 1-(5-phosphoribosyl)-5-((5-phosphoribosylamino)methylideneamino)imidazole-4-carboxamide isomerase [Planctomycetes bacterium]|nr:1-(5-phosphoribosyl)-5-((5-phosphoribosylamino)methylideneamino)imidazole-4-carboxamide isomerase [Planctomycetota bacterium]